MFLKALFSRKYVETSDDIEQIIFILYEIHLLYKDDFNTLIKLIKHYIKICNKHKKQFEINIHKQSQNTKYYSIYDTFSNNTPYIINISLKGYTLTKVIKTFSKITNELNPCNVCNKRTKTYTTCKYKCLIICVACLLRKYGNFNCMICKSKIPILKLTRKNI